MLARHSASASLRAPGTGPCPPLSPLLYLTFLFFPFLSFFFLPLPLRYPPYSLLANRTKLSKGSRFIYHPTIRRVTIQDRSFFSSFFFTPLLSMLLANGIKLSKGIGLFIIQRFYVSRSKIEVFFSFLFFYSFVIHSIREWNQIIQGK